MKNVDGRNIDPALGRLEGEGAQVRVENRAAAFPGRRRALDEIPSEATEDEGTPTYYGQPAIKQPTWIWSIPLYFYVGGVAGASAVLGAAAQLTGDDALRPLVQRCRWVAAVGSAASAGLLIHDLGKPARFLNMLRVFRPTSPMNVGTWVVSGAGAASGTAAVFGKGRIGDAAGLAAGVLGLPFAGYTAVLISNTAVPLWQASRRSLPVLFVASAAAGTGSLFSLFDQPPRQARITRRLGIAGKVVELVAARAVEREAARTPRVARPLHEGLSGALWKAAKWLDLASLALDLAPGDTRAQRRAAGIAGTIGSIALRYAVMRAGKRSAADPVATFRQQRDGYGASEVTGRAAPTGPAAEAVTREART